MWFSPNLQLPFAVIIIQNICCKFSVQGKISETLVFPREQDIHGEELPENYLSSARESHDVPLFQYLKQSTPYLSDDNPPNRNQTVIKPAKIVSSCKAFIDAYANVVADFTRCSVVYARPLRFCEHCVQQYIVAKSYSSVILKVCIFCKDVIEGNCS